MRSLLVDDEPLAVARLRAGFAAIPEAQVVGTAHSGAEALDAIGSLAPDLVLLDIQMPGMSGLAAAEAIGRLDIPPEVIFVTAFDRFAMDAFAVDAVDYLLKPVSFDRLRIAVDRARRRSTLRQAEGRAAELEAVVSALRRDQADPPAVVSGYDDGIWVPGRGGAVRVPVETIDWIEAVRDYVLLNTPTKSHILRSKMSDLESRLDPAVIVRTHRSHMVRLAAVKEVQRPGKGALLLVLADGATLQVGPSYVERVARALGL